MAEFVFDENSNGTSVTVPRGSKITIELKEDPTSSCKWKPQRVDEVFLALEGDLFLMKDPARAQATIESQAEGVRQFFYRAKAAGHTIIRFVQEPSSSGRGPYQFTLSLEISK